MTLTEQATHICEQVGMNDTDDVAAAKMFLQRRFEMIWNAALWRAALVEATMTLGTDGSVDLAGATWIPTRATLLLPPEIDLVLAVRQSGHSMNVASLESYYRQETDYLSMQGDSTEFQILRPAVCEFTTAQTLLFGAEATCRYSTDLVTTTDTRVVASGTIASVMVLFRVGGAAAVSVSNNTGPTLITSDGRKACQRVRLTAIPNVSTSIRVLGKTACPTLGAYDEASINNVEPCLMAFARGDMLMRQRQHGKAQLAQQEGAVLLKQLKEVEAYQQASQNRIIPSNGFGGEMFSAQNDHAYPL